jgi:hypothetical protein
MRFLRYGSLSLLVRSSAVVLTLSVSRPAVAGGIDIRRPMSDPCILRSFADFSEEALGMRPEGEIAAFVLLSTDGTLRLERWPRRATAYRETFTGTLPPHTVALVHTHPREWPRPAAADVNEAVRLGIPSYVLSRRIWVVDPETGASIELAKGGWLRIALRSRCEPGAQPDEPSHTPGADARRAE